MPRNGKTAFSTPFGTEPLFAQTVDTTAVEFGIACESCQGPPAEHVRANRSPVRRYTLHLQRRADSTIVQPLRLDARRSSEVCGQCHGAVGVLRRGRRARGERERTAVSPRRRADGEPLHRSAVSEHRLADDEALLEQDPNFVSDIFWSDGMVRATGREYNGLIDSPCYKNATDEARTLSCFSCHAMHRRADDARPIGRMGGRSAEAGSAGQRRVPAVPRQRSARERRPRTRITAPSPAAAPATTATCRTRRTAC